MHEDGLSCGRPFGAEWAGIGADIEVAIDEIGDDLDGAADVEFGDGAILEVAGDGSDGVTLLDGEAGDGEVAAVAADEGDIGAVEGGDEREAAGRSEHGTSEEGADRMRDGVMDVEEVEASVFGDLGHFGGEGEGVGRMIEERIGSNLDFVEEDASCGEVSGITEANGDGVADEMDFVAASGQLHAELRGDDA